MESVIEQLLSMQVVLILKQKKLNRVIGQFIMLEKKRISMILILYDFSKNQGRLLLKIRDLLIHGQITIEHMIICVIYMTVNMMLFL